MANLIDKLLVSIGLDPKEFLDGKKKVDEATKDTEKKTSDSTKKTEKESLSANKKVSEESVKQQKEIALRTKQSAEAYSKVRGEVLGLATAFMATAGIKGFVSGANNADQSIGQFSKNIGVSTEKLSAWYGVVERFGGTAEDIASAFRLTQKIVEEIKYTGDSASLRQLGFTDIDLSKFADSATTAEQRMSMLSASFSRMNEQGKRADALYIGGQAGFSEATMNVLLLGPRQLDELIARQEKLNATTAIDVENASKRINLYADLSARITRLGKNVLNDVTPAMLKLGDAIDRIVQIGSKNLVAVEVVLGTIALITFAGPVMGIWRMVSALGSFIGLAGGSVMLGFAGTLGVIGASIYSIVANLNDLRKEWQGIIDISKREGVNLAPGRQEQLKNPANKGKLDEFDLGWKSKINKKEETSSALPLPKGMIGDTSRSKGENQSARKSPMPEGFFGPEFFGTSSKQASSYAESLASSQRRFNTNQNTQSNQITVGEIKVYSNNSDPAKVASEIPLAIKNYDFAAQGQFGAQ